MKLEDATDYVAASLASGELEAEDVAMLTAAFQEYVPDEIMARILPHGKALMVDGKPGPMTRKVLEAAFTMFARATPPPEALPPPPAPAQMSPYVAALMRVCAAEEGNGEEGHDNSGKHICRYRGLPASWASRNLGRTHHWCSFSAGYMVRCACDEIGQHEAGRFMMFHDENFDDKEMPIGGARDLVYRMAMSKHGEWVARGGKLLKPLLPGDAVAIRYDGSMNERRGAGHVWINRTADGDMGTLVTTWEGNLGPFPALWKSRKRDVLALGGSARLLQAARLVF